MEFDLVAIGELLADLISENFVHQLKDVEQYRIYQGGSPANVCANLNYLGRKTALIACVGSDSIGDMLIDSLQQIGVNTQFIQRTHSIPSSLVLVGKSDNTPPFLAYRMADKELTVPSVGILRSARIVHTTAFALSKDPAQSNILHALITASLSNKIISCDWNFAPQIWESNDGMDVFETICTLQPLLKLSMDDFQRFVKNPNAQIEDALQFLSHYPTRLTCLTAGSKGVWYKEHHSEWKFSESVHVDDVKDTTGAGDAFWAGVLNGYLQYRSITECIYLGCETAAQKIIKVGPIYLS